MTVTVLVGELRKTSAGNVFQLERIDGERRYVRRVSDGSGRPLWDAELVYCWWASQWEEQLPRIGEDGSDYPHFGVFAPRV